MSRNTSAPTPSAKPRSIQPLVWILLVCLAPVLLALGAYYLPALGIRPESGSNYGHLINPQRPLPHTLELTTLDGQSFDIQQLKGKWILITADEGRCPESCVEKLFILRNSHASQGKNVERLSRVWFITDDSDVPAEILTAYAGTLMIRVQPDQLATFLTPETPNPTTKALSEGMWIIDPRGNLMLQFPDDADPIRVRNDITKLVRNSRIG